MTVQSITYTFPHQEVGPAPTPAQIDAHADAIQHSLAGVYFCDVTVTPTEGLEAGLSVNPPAAANEVSMAIELVKGIAQFAVGRVPDR